MARRKIKPGDPDYRPGLLGDYWEEKGEGKVVALTQTQGGREISTSPAKRGGRNAMLAVEAFHLDDPISLTVDTQDPSLPHVVRHEPETLIEHTIGYCAVVRRTQAFVEWRTLEPPTTNLDLPIERVPGMDFKSGNVFKVRELVAVFEIDGKPPEAFGGPRFDPLEDSKPEQFPWTVERIHSQTALEAHVRLAVVADKHLRHNLRGTLPTDVYAGARRFVRGVVERVARMIDRDGPDPTSPTYMVAIDLVDAALYAVPLNADVFSRDGLVREVYEQRLLYFVDELHTTVAGWGLESGT